MYYVLSLTVRLSGSPLLVTGLAEQDPRPKRIGPLTLPLASFGDPLIAGVLQAYILPHTRMCDIFIVGGKTNAYKSFN